MDGLYWKTPLKWMILGEKPTISGNTQIHDRPDIDPGEHRRD